MDGRRALNSAIGEANVEVAHNLANEIERRYSLHVYMSAKILLEV